MLIEEDAGKSLNPGFSDASTGARRYGDASRWSGLTPMTRDEAAAALSANAAPYYVYVLWRPERVPFYVGKGTGRRLFQHEAETWNGTSVSHKLNVIRHIRKQGKAVGYTFDGFFEEERAALARERALIAWYGRHDLKSGPLTNQIDGGEGASNPSAESQARHAASLGGDAADPERQVANRFLASIAGPQASIPIKPWGTICRRAHLLRPSPGKPVPGPRPRMAKALVASAVANGVLLEVGAIIPRRLIVDGVECVIENGCGGDMIHAGMVEPVEPRTTALAERLRLTSRGLSAVVGLVGESKLVDLGILPP
jgi:hypothetical protein